MPFLSAVRGLSVRGAALWGLVGGVLACGQGEPEQGSLVFQALQNGQCMTARMEAPPEDLDRLVVAVINQAGQEVAARSVPIAELGGGSGVLLSGVPQGTWRLQVAGCRGPQATWWTEDQDLLVEANTKVTPLLTLRPVEGASCIGGENLHPLAPRFAGDQFILNGKTVFGAGAAGPEGQVLLAGGAARLQLPDYAMKGERWVWEFLPASGLFRVVRDSRGDPLFLLSGRLGHGMAVLDGNRVAVFGGASGATLAPKEFPGEKPPLYPDREPVIAPLEVIDRQAGRVEAVSIEGLSELPPWPAVAVWRDAAGQTRAFLAAGGWGADGAPSDGVWRWDPDALEAPLTARLAHRRFGATAVFLSHGETLVVGGWSGSSAPPPELLVVGADGRAIGVEEPDFSWPPEGITPAAFPVLAVVSEDDTQAQVLVLGGNPLGSPMIWNNPDAFRSRNSTTAWRLTLPLREGAYRLQGATAEPVTLGEAGEAGEEDATGLRSLAGIFPWTGRDGPFSWLLIGGYRSFGSLKSASPAECRNADGTAMNWCFPRRILVLKATDTGFTVPEFLEDRSRLGATTVLLPTGEVLVLGGLSAFGGDTSAATAGKSTEGNWVESSGLLLTPGGGARDALCQRFP